MYKFPLYIVLFLSGILFYSNLCYSQPEKGIRDVPNAPRVNRLLKTNLLPIICGPIWYYTSEYRLVYENAIARKQSVQIGASYLGKSMIQSRIEESDTAFTNYDLHYKIYGFRFQAAYRFYPFSKGEPKGFYISPMVSYSSAKITTEYWQQLDQYIKIVHVNYNLLGGVQFAPGDAVCIDLFWGLGYKQNDWLEKTAKGTFPVEEEYIPDTEKLHIKFTFGFNFGIVL